MTTDQDKTCPECGHGPRAGVEIRGVYDGVLFWECPGCKHRWHRWEDPEMRARAEPWVTKCKGSGTMPVNIVPSAGQCGFCDQWFQRDPHGFGLEPHYVGGGGRPQ